MAKRSNGFDKDPSRAAAAGAKGKRGVSILTRLKKKLEQHPERVDEIVESIIVNAIDGTPADRKLLMEYLDGKAVDKLEVTGADGGAVETVALDPKKYAKMRKDMLKEDDC